jgi:hypothetical protein
MDKVAVAVRRVFQQFRSVNSHPQKNREAAIRAPESFLTADLFAVRETALLAACW